MYAHESHRQTITVFIRNVLDKNLHHSTVVPKRANAVNPRMWFASKELFWRKLLVRSAPQGASACWCRTIGVYCICTAACR